MALRASSRMLSAVKPKALHGSFGEVTKGSYSSSWGLIPKWVAGFKAHVNKDGLTETVYKLLRHKDVRYFLPQIEKVGEDEFGNQFFIDNGDAENPQMKTRQRRVIYGGDGNQLLSDYPFETSRISPAWYAWLHQMDDRIPEKGEKLAPATEQFLNLESGTTGPITPEPYKHVSQFRPNQTTNIATMDDPGGVYYQPGHLRGGNHRIQTYEAWNGEAKETVHVKTHGGVPVANVKGDSSQL